MQSTDDAAAAAAGDQPDGVRWRRLGDRLWVGHDGTVGVGTIEQGARYVYIDADGVARPGVASLHEAQFAATGPIPLPAQGGSVPRRRLRPGVLVLPFVLVLLLVLTWVIGRALLVG